MRISNLRREGVAAVSATVLWEDSERPPREIFFETDPEFGPAIHPDPNAFLVAACFPAIRHGERRIAFDGPVSPRLRDGLRSVAALFRSWYGGDRRDIRIEAANGFEPPLPCSPRRAAAFLSGGIDSPFTLRRNRRATPRSHPTAIRDVLWLVGRDFPGQEDSPAARAHARALREALEEIARDADVRLVPVRTNSRELEPDLLFFGYEFQGAYVASAAHVFSGRLDTVSFSSGWDMGHLIPWGTHPLVDTNLGTEGLEIRHEGAAYGRLEKLRGIADWEVGIRNLVVCNEGPTEASLNCGRCYKCIETMTLLLSEGLLSSAARFPASDVTPERIAGLTLAPNLRSSFAEYASFWEAMAPALERRGRSDLVEAIRAKLADARRLEAWLRESDWKGRLRRLDRRLTKGWATRMIRSARGRRDRS